MSTPDAQQALAAMATPVRRLPARPAPVVAPVPEPPAAAEPPDPAPTKRRAPAKKAPGRPATGRRSRDAGLPIPLVEPMDAAAHQAGQSRGDWLMQALNDTWDEQETAYPPLPVMRPELPPARRPPRQTVPGGRAPVNFRLTDEQLAAIETRQKALHVESRSEFITTVVELGLARAPKPVVRKAASGRGAPGRARTGRA